MFKKYPCNLAARIVGNETVGYKAQITYEASNLIGTLGCKWRDAFRAEDYFNLDSYKTPEEAIEVAKQRYNEELDRIIRQRRDVKNRTDSVAAEKKAFSKVIWKFP
jgi:hypothetical protein